jgi:small subunit ribosomal protein S19
MARSIKKGPYVSAKLEKKIVNMNEGKLKRGVLKTWSRRSTITPDFVGHTFAVHNGNKFIPVYVTGIHGRSQAWRVCTHQEFQRTFQQESITKTREG